MGTSRQAGAQRSHVKPNQLQKILTLHALAGIYRAVDIIQVYKCFCDKTRLRILNLLREGPLCVCHLQEILNLPQVALSKHLAYMRKRNLIQASRSQNWVIYSIPNPAHTLLEENLRCLQDCQSDMPDLKKDLAQRKKLLKKISVSCGTAPERVLQSAKCC